MLTRSLATYMNAYTATDYTLYPFSTINPKDYSNLMSVYLDAAFFPLLSKQACRLPSFDEFSLTDGVLFRIFFKKDGDLKTLLWTTLPHQSSLKASFIMR